MGIANHNAIVVGGGPGGSTAATLLAKAGARVLLVEKEKFPRYQIGESLLPATVHGICRLLGVSDDLHAAGFIKKRGGTFRWGKHLLLCLPLRLVLVHPPIADTHQRRSRRCERARRKAAIRSRPCNAAIHRRLSRNQATARQRDPNRKGHVRRLPGAERLLLPQ